MTYPPCPTCNHEPTRFLGTTANDHVHWCPVCGTSIRIETDTGCELVSVPERQKETAV